ncbi:hypothetical protein LOZ65_004497 [Ophidiomyces ophidiicola]|nr:hypothetical protein LOZ65_004497 [Ophidiomyces ophidiicola]
MAAGPLVPAFKSTRKFELEGRSTIAYVSESSRRQFLNLPEEAHERLRRASAELNAQNSFVQSILSNKTDPLEMSPAQQYELARYKVDFPSPIIEERDIMLPPVQTMIGGTVARLQYMKTKEDFMEYLVAQFSHWELSDCQFRQRDAARSRLLRYVVKAIQNRLTGAEVQTVRFTIRLKCFGSFRSGFAIPSSDMDFALVTKGLPSELEFKLPTIVKQACVLAGYNVLSANPESNILTISEPLRSSDTVQVYHLYFSDFALKMRTSTLLRCYRSCDDRIYEMGVFIKTWAHARQIDDVRNGTLPSFCYILMLVHYLMNIAKPPVVPNLQLSNIGRRNLQWIDGNETFFWDDFEEIARTSRHRKLTHNCQTTAELLRGFFTYFSPTEYSPQYQFTRTPKFNWKLHVVSIRCPNIVYKTSKDWGRFNQDGRRAWTFLAVEDPFNPQNNMAQNVDLNTVFLIREEFERVNMIMNQAQFVSGFGWEWINENGEAGEDIFQDRLPHTSELQQ